MARPVEIDRDAAFETARQMFWRRGYGATSMQDLLDAMQISRSSFYAAFSSKQALFESVLNRHLDIELGRSALVGSDANEEGLDALSAFLHQTVVDLPAEERVRGCLFVNTVLELEGVDPSLHQQAARALSRLRRAMFRWLKDARDAEQLRTDIPLEALVDIAELAVKGLRVASREGLSRAELGERVDSLVAMLVAPQSAG